MNGKLRASGQRWNGSLPIYATTASYYVNKIKIRGSELLNAKN